MFLTYRAALLGPRLGDMFGEMEFHTYPGTCYTDLRRLNEFFLNIDSQVMWIILSLGLTLCLHTSANCNC